jgi:hypothetical protein
MKLVILLWRERAGVSLCRNLCTDTDIYKSASHRYVKCTQESEFFASNFEFCPISLLVKLKYKDFVKKKLIGQLWGEV